MHTKTSTSVHRSPAQAQSKSGSAAAQLYTGPDFQLLMKSRLLYCHKSKSQHLPSPNQHSLHPNKRLLCLSSHQRLVPVPRARLILASSTRLWLPSLTLSRPAFFSVCLASLTQPRQVTPSLKTRFFHKSAHAPPALLCGVRYQARSLWLKPHFLATLHPFTRLSLLALQTTSGRICISPLMQHGHARIRTPGVGR